MKIFFHLKSVGIAKNKNRDLCFKYMYIMCVYELLMLYVKCLILYMS